MTTDVMTRLAYTFPWRVVIDDTGGEFSGWPSIAAAPDADMAIVHLHGFKQEFWGDLSQRDAIAVAQLIVDLANQAYKISC
jgi:hypothetical protein